jgi:putative tryptophan/tyrosine transport system substrate-binding protein
MKRRAFIAAVGGAAASPLVARAQSSAMPIIGFLNPQSPEAIAEPMRGLRQGLKDTGFVEGENLTIEYRWADNQTERLTALAEDLVRRGVALIISTGGVQSALAAKAATTSVPIVFNVADDPVSVGLVASLAKPGGNLTGVAILVAELTAKRLELLHTMVPSAVNIAVLSNPHNPAAKIVLGELEGAAQSMGLKISSFQATTSQEIDAVFANFARERVEALFVAGDAFFLSRRVQLALLAVFHKLPVIAALRDLTEAGGLMSYGASLRDAYRQVGNYAGRILKGGNPVDLPVVQASKFELVINSQTARILRLTVPPSLLATADETLE